MFKYLQNERGAAIVLVALALAALVGFAAITIDVGLLYMNKVQLSNIVDAATLAGAQELPNALLAETKAIEYIGLNEGDLNEYDIRTLANEVAYNSGQSKSNKLQHRVNGQRFTVSTGRSSQFALATMPSLKETLADLFSGTTVKAKLTTVSTNYSNYLSIVAERPVDLYFARILGFTQSKVTAQAYAVAVTATGASGIVPFGVEKQQFQFGETYFLKAGGGDGYSGNYGGLALGGKGANTYRFNIQYGYDSVIRVGDQISTEPGNMSGPTSDGVNYRIGLDPTATYETVKPNSPRVITVPIIDNLDVNGRSQVTVVGFAAFFLEGVGGSGSDNYVYGKFKEMVGSVEITSGAIPAQDFGLHGVKLYNSREDVPTY